MTPASPAFSGSPRWYFRLALALGFGTHAYLYAGMVLIEYAWRGETWMFSWKLIAAVCASALLLSRLSHVCLMSLDARYGKGSRWQLREAAVKLPEFKTPA